MLVLDKSDLYNIDREFKKEIFLMFKNSKQLIKRLNHSASRAKLWLKNTGQSGPAEKSVSQSELSSSMESRIEEEEEQSNESQCDD